MTAADVAAGLRRFRFGYVREAEIHDGVEQALARMFPGAVRRELVLSGGKCRLDLALDCPDGRLVAVEVKTRGSLSDLTRQLARYAAHPDVGELVAVVTRSKLLDLPSELGGKPLAVVHIGGML